MSSFMPNSFLQFGGQQVLFKTGSFVLGSGTGNQSITGVGFKPKAIILYTTATSTDDSIVTQLNLSYGFSDGTNDKCISNRSENGVATSVCNKFSSTDKILIIIANASDTILTAAELFSFDSDGFTINKTTNTTSGQLIKFTVIGGDTEWEVGQFDSITTTGVQNISTGIPNADFVILMSTQDATIDTIDTQAAFSLGVATSVANQGVTMIRSRDALSTTDTVRYQRTNKIVGGLSIGTQSVNSEAAFDGFTSSGFDIDWTNSVDVAIPIYFLTGKGGQWEVGNGDTPIIAETKPYTTAFKPKGLGMFGFDRTASSSPVGHTTLTIGGGDETNETSISVSDQDALTVNSNTHRLSTSSSCYSAVSNSGGSINHIAVIDSFNDTDFTLDFTTVDGTAAQFFWWICGDA